MAARTAGRYNGRRELLVRPCSLELAREHASIRCLLSQSARFRIRAGTARTWFGIARPKAGRGPCHAGLWAVAPGCEGCHFLARRCAPRINFASLSCHFMHIQHFQHVFA